MENNTQSQLPEGESNRYSEDEKNTAIFDYKIYGLPFEEAGKMYNRVRKPRINQKSMHRKINVGNREEIIRSVIKTF